MYDNIKLLLHASNLCLSFLGLLLLFPKVGTESLDSIHHLSAAFVRCGSFETVVSSCHLKVCAVDSTARSASEGNAAPRPTEILYPHASKHPVFSPQAKFSTQSLANFSRPQDFNCLLQIAHQLSFSYPAFTTSPPTPVTSCSNSPDR
jgi:hypothetical protein